MEKNVELHLHTDAYFSGIGDGSQTVVEAIDNASRLGATSVAITDHGNCANWVDFFNYARGEKVDHTTLKSKGLSPVKPILGVEAYIAYPEHLIEDKTIRAHLILLAKDYTGFQQISRFISECNKNLDEKNYPVGTKDLLRDVFKDGHVFATSACIQGTVSLALLKNERITKEIDKINRRIDKIRLSLGDEYTISLRHVNEVTKKIDKLNEQLKESQVLAKKSYKKRITALNKILDSDKRAKEEEALAIEMNESERAKELINDIKNEIKSLRKNISDDKKVCSKANAKFENIKNNEALINILNGLYVSEEELYKDAKKEALEYKEIFGDSFFLELQYHGLDKEALVMPKIASLAKELGIECTIANDVHIATKEDYQKRELIRNSLNLNEPWHSSSPSDKELYYKTDDERIEYISQIINKETLIRATENVHKIAENCNLDHISEAHHYPKYENDHERLRELALTGHTIVRFNNKDIEISNPHAGVYGRFNDKWNKVLNERLEYELSVIEKMDFSSYFLFIADVINKCKVARDNATDIGLGRGSGAGSLVCYLCAITELNPLKYDLLFERFLNPSRVSMPDIDTDFSKFARGYAIDYVTKTYGSDSVTGIMTKMKMGARQALTYAPKLYSKEIYAKTHPNETGTDLKMYSSVGAKLRSYITDLKTSLSDIEQTIKKDFTNDTDALTIFEYAKKLEGMITSYGQHAAGVIAIMDGAVEDYIPLMSAVDVNGERRLVIQADMVSAEAQLGFIKFDFLGLKNLNVITACQQLITKNYDVRLDTYNLPLDDRKVYEDIFQTANTNFVFQFESDGMKDMLKKLKPTRFEDLILAVSVYRPGPMDFIPDIINCKNNNLDSEIVKRFPVLKDILNETYGYPVYQEQVMKIMTTVAGFDLAHADNVRRFMSKKKEDELRAEKPLFVQGAIDNGTGTKENAEWLFEQLMPFANYGFNKSHATAYSYVSYITAYMKEYYPKEYLCSAMLEQSDKTSQLLSDCKRLNINVRPVDIRLSKENFTVEDDTSIRMGLSLIKGLKNDAQTIVDASKNIQTLEDVAKIENCKINSIEACILSGACDNLITENGKEVTNRNKAFDYVKVLKEINDNTKAIETKINDLLLESPINEKSLSNAYNKKEELYKLRKDTVYNPFYKTSDKEKRAYELEYLGLYTSGSPLDGFDLRESDNINDKSDGDKLKIIGVVNDFKEITTKNGDKMALFRIFDANNNNTKCVCFPREYEKLNFTLDDDKVIKIVAELKEEDEQKEIIVSKIIDLEKDGARKMIHMNVPDLSFYYSIQDDLMQFARENGVHVIVNIINAEYEINATFDSEITNYLEENDIEFQEL